MRFSRLFGALDEPSRLQEKPSPWGARRLSQLTPRAFRLGQGRSFSMTYTNTRTPTLTRWQPWTFRDQGWLGTDLTGYKIDALDGNIGKVDEATFEVDNSYLIV